MAKVLKRFLEMYPGSSFPTRSETLDGEVLIVKMRGAGNGSSSLLSEYLVNRIASAAGLPVPEAFVVDIPKGFPWEFGTDEFYDLVLKSSGPNLGLAYLDSATPVKADAYNQLPHELVSQVVTLDLVFHNLDRPASSGNLLKDKRGQHWIIDHGSCCFLFQQRSPEFKLPANHAFAGWEATFDPRWFESITPEKIEQFVTSVPDEWLDDVRMTRIQVLDRTLSAFKAR